MFSIYSLLVLHQFFIFSFNPVAHTSLVKTLQKIANSECQRKASGGSKSGGSKRSTAKGAQEVKFHMPPKDVIECLASNSDCQRKTSGGSTSAGGSKRSAAKGPQEMKFHMPPKDVIECLASSSAGDIRSAINALQFACLKGKSIAWMTYIVRVALHLTDYTGVCKMEQWCLHVNKHFYMYVYTVTCSGLHLETFPRGGHSELV